MEVVPLDYQNATVTLPASVLTDILNALAEDFREKVLVVSTVSRVADKRSIKAAIGAGVDVPGVELVTGKTTLGRR